MKRLLLTAVAGLMIAGPMSLPAFAQQGRTYQQDRQQSDGYQRQDGYQYRQDDRGQQQGYQDNRDSNRDWRGNDRGHNDRDRVQRSKYHGKNEKWRDSRRNARWNDRDYNGFYVGNSWHYGQPSARDYSRHGFALGYQPWQRGDRLGSYGNRYQEVDYRDYRVQRPPQGSHWVKDDNNDLILAVIATGVIAAIIAGND